MNLLLPIRSQRMLTFIEQRKMDVTWSLEVDPDETWVKIISCQQRGFFIWVDGKAGVVGISYPGFAATEASVSGHPALIAVSAQAPTTDAFRGG